MEMAEIYIICDLAFLYGLLDLGILIGIFPIELILFSIILSIDSEILKFLIRIMYSPRVRKPLSPICLALGSQVFR